MIPLVLALLGIGTLAGGWLVMRSIGPRARIGRILASTTVVPVDRAVELARSGKMRYVAVGGRLDAAEEFLDENERPLVFRRTRLELGTGRASTLIEDRREALPFEIAGGAATIAVDHDAIADGLVVVVRESVGTAGEIPDRVPEGTPPQTPARLQVEQLSTVDHALVLGVPVLDPDRGPILRAGLGRPLILTTIEPAEAMRLLAMGRRGRTLAASTLLGLGALLVAVGLAWALLAMVTGTALAASPTPSAPVGDPRSSGQGPGLVGDPLLAIAIVAAIGLASLVATLLYVRATGGARTPGPTG